MGNHKGTECMKAIWTAVSVILGGFWDRSLQERLVLGPEEQSPEKSLHIWCKIKDMKNENQMAPSEAGGGGVHIWIPTIQEVEAGGLEV